MRLGRDYTRRMANTLTTGMPQVDALLAQERARLIAAGYPEGVIRNGIGQALGKIHYRDIRPAIREAATLDLLRAQLPGIEQWCERYMAGRSKIVPNWQKGLREMGLEPGPESTAALQEGIDRLAR